MPEVPQTDNLPVLAEVRPLAPPPPVRGGALALRTPSQATVVAIGSFVAGAATLALVHRRRLRRAMHGKPGRRSRGRKRGELISVAGTRSFLVDVHLLDR